jgi:hypothetical protein
MPSGGLATFLERAHFGVDLTRIIPMKLPALALTAILGAIGPSVTIADASAAELSITPAYRSGHVHTTGYVLWDDVYPPAIYGPYLRSVEEVQALKAERRPVSVLWWGGNYNYTRW